jgi:alpha-glucosidase
MNKLIFSLIAVLLVCQSEAQNQWTVSSPDKLHQLVLSLNKGNLTYQVLSGNATVVQPSAMGVESRQERFSNNLSFVRTTTRGINEQYSLLIGKRKENKAVGQETSVVFKTKSNSLLQVDMRAYNDGVAFRYSFPNRGKKLP